MKRLALWLFPMAVCAGQARYARVGDFDGIVQVQLQAADEWQAARRNLPLRELSWLRTESASRVEVELDDGSVLRLGPDSLAELSIIGGSPRGSALRWCRWTTAWRISQARRRARMRW
jgi:hypothetical protein